MAQVINTNVASLNAQRNLNRSQAELGVSLQRLSSGLRINSAKDDAAGLAISERFTTQIRGLNQAARNANDGVSLAQTAEGDLAQITNNLQRIRELSVQSANATNSASDRAALQLEVTQLVAEIDRVASTSAFNGVNLLNGAFISQSFQVGANAGETVDIASISSARTAALGQTTGASLANTNAVTAAVTTGQLTVNGNEIIAAGDALAIATAITASDVNLTATATNVQTAVAFADVVGTAAVAATPGSTGDSGAFTAGDAGAAGEVFTLEANGVTLFTETSADAAATITAAEIDTAIAALDSDSDGIIDTTAGTASELSFAGTVAGGDLVLTTSDGNDFDIVVTSTFSTTAASFAGTDFSTGTSTITSGTPAVVAVAPTYTLNIDGVDLDLTTAGADGTITATEVGTAINALGGYTSTGSTGTSLNFTKTDGSNAVLIESGSDSNASEGLVADGSSAAATTTFRGIVATVVSASGDLTIAGTTPGNAGLTAGVTAESATLQGVTIAATDISTVAGANAALLSADAALTTISTSRSSLGAIQNRFESIVSSISTSVENLSAARSRIRDADFAAETANLTRNQILQQAGVSILSQANALPQLALSLLQ